MKQVTHEDTVYDAILDLLFTSGVRGWNMDTLAKRAGLSKRTLYKIIPSKEKAVEEAILRMIRDIQSRVRAHIEEGPDFPGVLDRLMEDFPAMIASLDPARLFEIFTEYPGIRKTVILRREELTASVRSFFQKGVDQGYLQEGSDPGIIVEIIQALVLYYKTTPSMAWDSGDRLRKAITHIKHGLVQRGDNN